MNLEDLERFGGIVSAELVKCEVTLQTENEQGEPEDKPFAVFIKRLAFSDYELLANAVEAAPKKNKKSRQATIISIAASIGENGEVEIPYDRACRMDPSLATQIIAQINQVNSRKKHLPQATNSGTS